MRQGSSGAVLATMPTVPTAVDDLDLRSLGDLNGDGRQDLAVRYGWTVIALRTQPAGQVWSTTPSAQGSSRIDTFDLDGDGKREVLHRWQPPANGLWLPNQIDVLDGPSGQLRFTIRLPQYGTGAGFASMCGVGDLDADGTADVAVGVWASPGRIEIRSGATGRRLWSLASPVAAPGLGATLARLGDVDGDGAADLVAGHADSQIEGWSIVSAKILADTQAVGTGCGGGPFFPQLGATRPILGQTATIAGTGTPGASGLVVLSLQPALPTYLGVGNCYAWFDLGSGIVLHTTPLAQWTFALAVPAAPQLAGFELALQSLHAPTSGPLGYDLSNGVFVRIGHP